MQQFIHTLQSKPATQAFLAHATQAYNNGLLSPVTYDQILTGLKLAHRPQGQAINSSDPEDTYSDQETLIYILLTLILRQQELAGSSALKHSQLLKFCTRWNQLMVLAHTIQQCIREINTTNLSLLCHLPFTYLGDFSRDKPTTQTELLQQFKLYTIYQQQLFAQGYNFYSLELEALALHFLNQATNNQLEQLIPQVKKLPVRFINSENVAESTNHTLLPHLLKRQLYVPFATDVATSNEILGHNFYAYTIARNQQATAPLVEQASIVNLHNPHQAIQHQALQHLARHITSNDTLFQPQTNSLTVSYLLASNTERLQAFPQRFYFTPEQITTLSLTGNFQDLNLTRTIFAQVNPQLHLKAPLDNTTNEVQFTPVALTNPFPVWLAANQSISLDLQRLVPFNYTVDFTQETLLHKFWNYRQAVKDLIFTHKKLVPQLEQHNTLLSLPESVAILTQEHQLTIEKLQVFAQLYQQPINLTQACCATVLRPTLRYEGDLTTDFDWDNPQAPQLLQQLVKQLLNNQHLNNLSTQQRINRKIITFIEKQPYQPHDFIDRFVADKFSTPHFMSFNAQELANVFQQLASALIPFDDYNFAPELVRFFHQAFELFSFLTQPLSLNNLHPGKLFPALASMHNLYDWTSPTQYLAPQPQVYNCGLISVINAQVLEAQDTIPMLPFVVQRELLENPRQANIQPEYLWSLSRSHRLETELYQQLKHRVYAIAETDSYSTSTFNFSLSDLKAELFKFITIYRGNPQDFGEQELAIASSLNQNFSCIIGGPGSGKTTTVFNILLLDAIIYIACMADEQAPYIGLIAPTGKAAEGLTKSIHSKATQFSNYLDELEAGTLQDSVALNQWRLIQEQFLPDLNNYARKALQAITQTQGQTIHKSFGINEFTPLGRYHEQLTHPADIVICDEVGMVNLEILHKVICYAKPTAKIIFLGDADQLPSIELGDTLANLSNQPRFISPQRQAMLQRYGFKLEEFIAPPHAPSEVKIPSKELITSNPLLSKAIAPQQLPTIADNIHTLIRIYRFQGNLLEYAYAINGRSAQTHQQSLAQITRELERKFDEQHQLNTLAQVQAQFVAHYAAHGEQVQQLAAKLFEVVSNLSYSADSNNIVDASDKENFNPQKLLFNLQYLSSSPADINLQYYEPLYLGYLLMVREILEQIPQLFLHDNKLGVVKIAEQILYDLVSCLAITSQRKLQELAHNTQFVRQLHEQIQKRSTQLLEQKLRYTKPNLHTFLQNLVLHQTAVRFASLLKILQRISQMEQETESAEFNQLLNAAFVELQEVRFLAPVREGVLGVDTLNSLFVERYNRNAAKVIMVTRNIPEHNLVNGQLGILTSETSNTSIAPVEVVYFRDSKSDQPQRVLKSQIADFEYAYYTTIHKAQGDEFTQTHVILPVELNANKISRALYFTAVTRVKKFLFIYSSVALQQITEFTNEPRTTSLNFCWDYQRLLEANIRATPAELPTIRNY